MEYEYIFTWIVYPERVNFSYQPIEFASENIIIWKWKIFIKNSKIFCIFKTEENYIDNIYELKNYIDEYVRWIVDTWCFVNSYNYDVEITNVFCEKLNFSETFNVIWEYNQQNKTDEEKILELKDIHSILEKWKYTHILLDIFADFRR